MSINIEEIKTFYQDCNKLLKDITIEWIKEDGTIGETINDVKVLEYVDKYNFKPYGYNDEYCHNKQIRYKCLEDKLININHYNCFGFQSLDIINRELQLQTKDYKKKRI